MLWAMSQKVHVQPQRSSRLHCHRTNISLPRPAKTTQWRTVLCRFRFSLISKLFLRRRQHPAFVKHCHPAAYTGYDFLFQSVHLSSVCVCISFLPEQNQDFKKTKKQQHLISLSPFNTMFCHVCMSVILHFFAWKQGEVSDVCLRFIHYPVCACSSWNTCAAITTCHFQREYFTLCTHQGEM